jgi:hypothetical protein
MRSTILGDDAPPKLIPVQRQSPAFVGSASSENLHHKPSVNNDAFTNSEQPVTATLPLGSDSSISCFPSTDQQTRFLPQKSAICVVMQELGSMSTDVSNGSNVQPQPAHIDWEREAFVSPSVCATQELYADDFLNTTGGVDSPTTLELSRCLIDGVATAKPVVTTVSAFSDTNDTISRPLILTSAEAGPDGTVIPLPAKDKSMPLLASPVATLAAPVAADDILDESLSVPDDTDSLLSLRPSAAAQQCTSPEPTASSPDLDGISSM